MPSHKMISCCFFRARADGRNSARISFLKRVLNMSLHYLSPVWTKGGEPGYTPPIVDSQNATPGQVLLGHLAITVPAVLAVPLVVYWGLGKFGPLLWPYYVTAGIAL